MEPHADVLVIGAGPVGLTLAIALRRLSMRVRIVDKASGRDREPKADVLFPLAGEALGSLGVGETIRQHAYEMQGANFYSDGRHVGSFVTGRLDSDYPRAMTIEQHDIERLLIKELTRRGVDVEWLTEATEVCQHGDQVAVTLRLRDGGAQVATAAWVVACDGNRSTVRQRLGIPFEGKRRANMQVIQGNVVPTWPLCDEPGHGYFFLAPYRSVIAFPTPGRGYRIFCVRDDPDPGRTEPPTLDELRDLIADAAGIPDLRLTLTEPVWLSRGRFADRVAGVLRRGRVLLAGDAAHAWAPIGGHGMNVGILGAHNLAWKLAAVHRGQAAESLLDSYTVEQRGLARGVIRDMKLNIMEALLPAPVHRARTAFLKAALPLSGFQRRAEWMMSDFGRNHRKSPLSWQRPWRLGRGPRAGDRVHDGVVVSAGSAAPVRLHRLLGYDRWTLLLAATRADAATLRRLRQACEHSTMPVEILAVASSGRFLGDVEDFKLIRPDGYIGLAAPLSRSDILHCYLTMLGAA
ncbi:FAD-dependent monooxygenase [Kutzneria sp. CA-103260]|uniref:FAD-dependent monooxygenase n=1 Tax=Kutzneria sp. CA-103260 TaxID=2802641 RepID=UPI001BA963A8|nr:FAD-dependent monooxygenase [Kutzneria sp. CA-103260]QUQ65453.1 oxygenase [Kutzneria sp. CA-103260]